MRRIIGIAVVVACVSFAGAVQAQQMAGRQSNVLLGGGLGAGWVRVSCDICERSRDLGPVVHFRVATRLSPQVLVGGEATGWMHTVEDEEDLREYVGVAHGVAWLYPRPHGPIYLKGGFGYVTYRADEIASNGIGIQVGAGYEFQVGDNLAITNHVSLVSSSFASLKTAGNTISDDVSVTLLQFGVGITRR